MALHPNLANLASLLEAMRAGNFPALKVGGQMRKSG